MRHLLILALALTSVCVHAQTYRWVDASGQTVFSDTPPPGNAKTNARTVATDNSGDGLPFAVKRARETSPVTLYTSPDCGADCQQARDLLNGRGVPFTEKLLKKQEDIDELKQLVGDAFVPSMKVGRENARGFNAGNYNKLLDLAGYPKTAHYGAKPSGDTSK